MKPTAWVLMLIGGGAVAAEINPMPPKPGLSGNLGAGVTYFSVESNFIPGNRLVDLENESIGDLNRAPGSESTLSPSFQLDLRYTLANGRSQWFFGNALQDLVRLDLTQQIGFRHKVEGWGTPSVSYVFSSVPTEVYQDPFELNVARNKTDRDSSGFRLGWDNIAGSPVGVTYTWREVEVEQERSGAQLRALGDLTAEEQARLRRDGTQQRLEVLALLDLAPGHRLAPELYYVNRDIDGEANAGDSYGVQLTYSRRFPASTLVLSGAYGVRDYDAANPIYERRADADEYGLAGTYILHNVLNFKQWDLLLGTAWYESDSDIDFYDTGVFAATATVLYRFQ
ncbi:DUF2860 family protein [Ferrimonas balearica]|uniref:DUF2860 family protein n=1 Tax=Ferrimonas balearica TaxID=44012 RepID=UPI001C99F5CE|nr:DUF2860 family protein [Ferrimonas balearica]MBY5991162.1 DUF2860 domain-containing protein [Ferrimonas balearica]